MSVRRLPASQSETSEHVQEAVAYWDRRPCNIGHSKLEVGTREYFDEVERRKYFVEPHIKEFAQFDRWKNRRVLDVGCGIGTDTVNFLRAGALVWACDSSPVSLRLTRQRVSAYGPRLSGSVCLPWEHLAGWLPLDFFDLVYAWGVLHHADDPARCLRVAYDLLGPDGELRLMVYHRRSWKALRIWLGLDQPEAQAGCPIWRTYTRASITALVRAAGFEVLETRVAHIFPWRLKDYKEYRYVKVWYFRWMPTWMFKWMERHFGWHLCVVARKTSTRMSDLQRPASEVAQGNGVTATR